MPRSEKLFRFLAGLMLHRFYGTVTIRFESGKVTHVETETRRMWQYKDLPEQVGETPGAVHHPLITGVATQDQSRL